MGQEQSTLAGEQASGFKHDYMTAHVKGVSSMQTPSKNLLQGYSAVGADSIMLSAAKKMQQNVSDSTGIGTTSSYDYKGAKPALGADAFLLQEMRHVKAEQPPGRSGGAAATHKPSVPADSFAITQAKKAKGMMENVHGVRNRFNLGASLPEPHSHVDGYETAFYTEVKKVTKGPMGSKGLDSINYTGVKPIVTNEDYYVEFGKATYKNTLPNRPENWQGKRPTIPRDYFVADQLQQKKAAIVEANKVDELPVPQVDSEAYMIKLSRDHTIASPTEIKYFGHPSPYHSYDDSEALMTQQILKAKEQSSPDRSVFQGVKANLGADTFMMNFSKTVSSFSPTRVKCKEFSKTPPKDIDLSA